MSENRDYYEVLGVDRDADARTIKRAFLKKARTVHPDVSDDPEAEAKFKELNEAYSVLSDEQKRANYDRYGTADGPGGSGYVDINDIFGGMGMDDLFSSFFGGGAGGGLDVEAQLIKSLNKRQSLFLILIGKGDKHGAVFLDFNARGLKRLVQRAVESVVVAYGLSR